MSNSSITGITASISGSNIVNKFSSAGVIASANLTTTLISLSNIAGLIADISFSAIGNNLTKSSSFFRFNSLIFSCIFSAEVFSTASSLSFSNPRFALLSLMRS